jgi:type I restriction enzyme R subunit
MSNFNFLTNEWRDIYESANKAESMAIPDPRTACFYARRSLELAVAWAFKYDRSLKLPYQDNISALIHEPTFKQTAGDAVFNKAKVIVTLGNRAVHNARAIPPSDALVAIRELFHFCYWFAHTYARQARPPASLSFDASLLPAAAPIPAQTLEQLQRLESALRDKDEKLSSLLVDNDRLDAELKRLQEEVAKAKKAALEQPDDHDYSESQTRDYFIDLLLKEAGWPLDQTRDREFEVAGMPNQKATGFVDYVLWGDDGKPLGLVEAKRTRRDPRAGQQQAKLYADCLETAFGQRPIIFYSNGYEHYIWDDALYSQRPVQGFYKKTELELLIQRRRTRKLLATAPLSDTIIERPYQNRAIRRIGESLEKDRERKALLVMATGAGKTRTVIALCDLLMRCNWAKRILFLADRVALVNQTANVFKKFLPDAATVNLVSEKNTEGRVFVSTYPTMMGLINDSKDGQRRFGVGHFDLVIIDEAHRSVFQKYRAIFSYFDSLLVGLTATPKDEVDRNTYSLFNLENGVPTDAYDLEEAVRDGYLVPPKAVSVPLKFQREGIKYKDLTEEEKDQWDALEWDEEGPPEKIEAEAVNKWLFNEDTVDKVLSHLMTRGLAVAGGDRLGKTIIFAKNQAHAEYIEERFNANYPHFKGEFARIITFKTEYAQSLIDNFSIKDKAPHIAISVDMLDTGIDVPEVVNLVFFKLVRSKTKFWQMLGRGTRLCPNLFGPDQDKEFFYVFDYCHNLEFFSQNPNATDGGVGDSLGKRLFNTRLELISTLDRRMTPNQTTASMQLVEDIEAYNDPQTEGQVRRHTSELLQREVASMNLDNFIVRPRRRLVEKYAHLNAWTTLSDEALTELSQQLAGLPSQLDPESEEAKRFDLLILNVQLSMLRAEPAFVRLRDQVKTIAGLLEEKSAIPMVRDQMALIQDIQTDEWWQDVTTPMLEAVRRKIRDLVKLIDKQKRKPIYTDFEDEIGVETDVELPGFSSGTDFDKFRAKARAFLRAHQDHIAIHKLRMNKALTISDLEELERLFAENGIGGPDDISRAKTESDGLGLFVRSLIGLHRKAAQESFTTFLSGKTLTADQIEFINLIINHLTEHGLLETASLYESPFTDITPHGPDGLFTRTEIDEIESLLATFRQTATAA